MYAYLAEPACTESHLSYRMEAASEWFVTTKCVMILSNRTILTHESAYGFALIPFRTAHNLHLLYTYEP